MFCLFNNFEQSLIDVLEKFCNHLKFCDSIVSSILFSLLNSTFDLYLLYICVNVYLTKSFISKIVHAYETEIATASEALEWQTSRKKRNNVKLISLSIQFNTERKQARLGM